MPVPGETGRSFWEIPTGRGFRHFFLRSSAPKGIRAHARPTRERSIVTVLNEFVVIDAMSAFMICTFPELPIVLGFTGGTGHYNGPYFEQLPNKKPEIWKSRRVEFGDRNGDQGAGEREMEGRRR
jgi:hypothetical protein